jgi:cytochrome c553
MAGAIALAATWMGGPSPAAAQTVAAGRQVAQQFCQTCHGMDGLAKVPDAANIAGQDAGYLTRQLEAFASGERKHEQMAIVAGQLTPEQRADAASYYGAIEIEVVKLPTR